MENYKTAICIASGPSLTQDDVDYVRGKGRVYVTNETGLYMAPWADVLYAADTDWWQEHIEQAREVFEGEFWTVSHRAHELYGINYVKDRAQWLWSNTQGEIATGGNSGFQIVNLAVLHGAERVIMLGYDMGHDENEQKHWFDDKHPPKIVRKSNFQQWCERFAKAAPHIPVPVLNASRKTRLDCFEKVKIKDVI